MKQLKYSPFGDNNLILFCWWWMENMQNEKKWTNILCIILVEREQNWCNLERTCKTKKLCLSFFSYLSKTFFHKYPSYHPPPSYSFFFSSETKQNKTKMNTDLVQLAHFPNTKITPIFWKMFLYLNAHLIYPTHPIQIWE